MLSAPPSRYRIIERGRRLITVDIQTGQELGLGAALPGIDLVGAKQSTAPPRQQSSHRQETMSVPVKPANRSVDLTRPASALAPLGRPTSSRIHVTPNNKNKGLLLLLGLAAVLVFLVSTGLWVIVVALLIVPQTRNAILPKITAGLKRYFGQDANG